MYVKKCIQCGGNSYSAVKENRWLCPYCNSDLTAEPAQIAGKKPESAKSPLSGRRQITNMLNKYYPLLAQGGGIGGCI